MKNLDVEINPAELGDVPIYPPRRILRDFLPVMLKTWLRTRFSLLPASPREEWVLKSLMLRVFYNVYRATELLSVTPKPFFASELPKQDKEYIPPKGWN